MTIPTTDPTIAQLNAELAAKADAAATTAALATKAPIASPTFTGTVAGISKTMVGLSNVDNTSDADKPVSTATSTALADKADAAATTAALATKADDAATTAALATKADDAATTAALAVKAHAARPLTGAAGRPGEEPTAFASVATGDPAGRPALALGSAVASANLGRAWRVNGADVPGEGYQDIAPRAAFALELGTVRRLRFEVARAVNPADPVGHGIECRVLYLDQSWNLVAGGVAVATLSPAVADGAQRVSVTVSRTAGQDITAPAGARYCVPFLRIYGADHQTDVSVIEAADVTDARVDAAASRLVVGLTSVAGTATAFTAVSPLTPRAGMLLRFSPHLTCGANATLTVTGPSGATFATTLRFGVGLNVAAGELVQGETYLIAYDGATSIVQGLSRGQPTVSRAARNHASTTSARLLGSSSLTPKRSSDESAIGLGGGEAYWLSSASCFRAINVSGTVWLNAENLPVGAGRGQYVYVGTGASCQVYAGPTGVWFGGVGHTATLASGTVALLTRPAQDSYHVLILKAGSVTYADTAIPVHDATVLISGQSNPNRLIAHAGLYGLQEALRAAGITQKIWYINAAFGAASMVAGYATVPENYFMETDGSPGPNTVRDGVYPDGPTVDEAITAAVALGQPVPSALVTWIGETEVLYLDRAFDGKNLPRATFAKARRDFAAWVRARVGNALLPVIEIPLGIRDGAAGAPGSSYAMARWAALANCANDANMHIGPANYDIEQPFDDVHPGYYGQVQMGLRLGRMLANLLFGQTFTHGPEIVGVQEIAGGLTYRLHVKQRDWALFRPTLDVQGIGIYPAGTVPTTGTALAWAPNGVVWSYDGGTATWYLDITLEAASPGASVLVPNGKGGAESDGADFSTGRFIRHIVSTPAEGDVQNLLPLRPFLGSAGVGPDYVPVAPALV